MLNYVLCLFSTFLLGSFLAQEVSDPYLIVLGTVQDAGSPHMGCKKKCCESLFINPDPTRMVVSLGIVDSENEKTWLIESTPDFPIQCKLIQKEASFTNKETPDGIFLTHAHIGHYAGLMYLGREAMGSSEVPVYAMTRMKGFLIQNGPWNQLVNIRNIQINNIEHNQSLKLSKQLSITPFLVPHRDEYSETVGYIIDGPNKKIAFIPDIDKWGKWNKDIISLVKNVDLAFIDGTFYDSNEINNRNMSEIPHPFVVESVELFKDLTLKEKAKVVFIHMNHTNPLLDSNSKQYKTVIDKGFKVAGFKQKIEL